MKNFDKKSIARLKNCILEPISNKEYGIYKEHGKGVYEMIGYCSKKHIKELIKLKNKVLYKDFKPKI